MGPGGVHSDDMLGRDGPPLGPSSTIAGEEWAALSGGEPAIRDCVTALARLGEEPNGIDRAVASVFSVARRYGPARLIIGRRFVAWAGAVVWQAADADGGLAGLLYARGVRRIRFDPILDRNSAAVFVRHLSALWHGGDIDLAGACWLDGADGVDFTVIDTVAERVRDGDAEVLRTIRRTVADLFPALPLLRGPDGPLSTAPERPAASGGAPVRGPSSAVVGAGNLSSTLLRTTSDAAQEARRVLVTDLAHGRVFDHLACLLSAVAVKSPSPLAPDVIERAAGRVLEAYLDRGGWWGFASAARTFASLDDAAESFPEAVRPALAALGRAGAGPRSVNAIARRLDTAPADFRDWVRWHFSNAERLDVDALLQDLQQDSPPGHRAFVLDIVRRLTPGALDRWRRLVASSDPELACAAVEVLSAEGAGAGARALLEQALRHEEAAVRIRAAVGISTPYSRTARTALLPLLMDATSEVRVAVVQRFAEVGDVSALPFVATVIRSPRFAQFETVEKQVYFETIAAVGGPRGATLIREFLGLPGPVRVDLTDALAAVHGLARLIPADRDRLVEELRTVGNDVIMTACEAAISAAPQRRSQTTGSLRWQAGPSHRSRSSDGARRGHRLLVDPLKLAQVVSSRPGRRRIDTASWLPVPSELSQPTGSEAPHRTDVRNHDYRSGSTGGSGMRRMARVGDTLIGMPPMRERPESGRSKPAPSVRDSPSTSAATPASTPASTPSSAPAPAVPGRRPRPRNRPSPPPAQATPPPSGALGHLLSDYLEERPLPPGSGLDQTSSRSNAVRAELHRAAAASRRAPPGTRNVTPVARIAPVGDIPLAKTPPTPTRVFSPPPASTPPVAGTDDFEDLVKNFLAYEAGE